MIKNVKDRDSEVCSVSSTVFEAGWNNLQRGLWILAEKLWIALNRHNLF